MKKKPPIGDGTKPDVDGAPTPDAEPSAESAKEATTDADAEHTSTKAASTGSGADMSRFTLPQDFGEAVQVEKVLTTIPVTRPNRYTFVRVHPTLRRPVRALRTKVEVKDELWLVEPALHEAHSSDLVGVMLYLAITRDGGLFLWPVKMPGPDGRCDHWSESAHSAAEAAVLHWVRVAAGTTHYDLFKALGALGDPTWPPLTFDEILLLAFKDRIISSADHPVLRRLRGEL